MPFPEQTRAHRQPEEPTDRIDPLDPMLQMEPEDPSERKPLTGTCIQTFWQQRRPARRSHPVRQPTMRPVGGMGERPPGR